MEDEALQSARERLTSNDPRLRSQSLYILCECDDRASLPAVAALLRDEDYRVRVASLHVVGKLRYVNALPDILLLLNDKESPVRAAAVAALGEIGDEQALEPLIASLTDPNAQTREAVVTALASLKDERAIKPLILSLQRDPAFHVRLRIVQTLPGFSDSSIVAALIDALHDRDEQVRAYAALNLGTLGDPQALPALEYMAANDDDEHWWYGDDFEHEVSATAEKAIAAIEARQAGGSPEMVEQIMARPYCLRHRMPDYTGCHKAFWRRRLEDDDEPSSRQGDSERLVEQIALVFRRSDRSWISKITVDWRGSGRYGANEDPRPEIMLPWEAWGALPYCADLLERLGRATGPAMSPDTFVGLLRQADFEDLDARHES